MTSFRTRLTFGSPRSAPAPALRRTAVQTVMGGDSATRTHVQFAAIFVLAQDYDDAMRTLAADLDRSGYERLAFTDQQSLALFSRVTAVISDMVHRGERIAALSMAPEHATTEQAGLAALEARQATEHALVEEGQAAIGSDIAAMRAMIAEARAEYRAETARQLQDVTPFPQAGSAAAELSILLSSQRIRHQHSL